MSTKPLKVSSLGRITGFLILTSALSRVLGYVREIVITTGFGQSWQTDAYKAAFMIPDFLYLILIGGAFSTAFIPILSQYITKGQEKDAWIIASTIFNLTILALGVGIFFCVLFTPQLIGIIAPDVAPATQRLAITLTRIMLVQSLFMCLAGIAQGICHVYQQFTGPALGSIVYNLAIIFLGLFLAPHIGVTGFAVGVVVGSVLNLAVHIPPLLRIRVHHHWVIALRHEGVRRFFKLVFPVLVGLSVIYLNTIVTTNLASGLPEGTITLLNNANRLMQLPVGIFAIAIASAYFPTLTALVASEDMAGFKKQLMRGVNLVCFLLLPASIGLIALREPIIRALFMQGAFTAENVHLTAQALLFYSIGILGYSQQQILNRGFYALSDTRSAVGVNVAIILVNIVLALVWVKPYGFRGLAFAYSVAGLLSMVLLYAILRYKIGPLGGRNALTTFIKTSIGAGAMYAALYFTLPWLEAWINIDYKSGQLLVLFLEVALGIGVFALSALVLRIEAAKEATTLVRRKLGRA